MAHCNQTDCIGCFGVECQSVMNGQCYTLGGAYCGDCHNCFDEDITTNNRNNRNQGGGHTHNYNTGPGSGQVDYFGNTDHASIGQHTHRITSNSIPPHTHPINPNEQGHYSSRMMVEDVWEGGPPMTVNDAIDRHGYDPSLQNGTHNHHNVPRVNRPPVPTSGQGGGTQNNLRTRQGQFINRRTGQPVPPNMPYHSHEGQAMAGARHSNRPHDKYDRVGGRRDNVAHISEGIKPSPPNISAPRPGNVKQACDSWCQVYTVPGYVSAQAFTSSCGGICDKDYSKMYVCNCVISPVYENLFDNDPYMAGYEIDAGDCKGNYTFRLDGYSFGNGNFHEGGNALHTSDTPYGDGYQSNILCDRQALMDYDASCPGPYHMSCNTNEDCAQYDYLGGNVFGNDSCFGEDCMVCDSGCCNCGCV